MPRPGKGPHLWFRKPWKEGGSVRPGVWIIRDGGRHISTRCGAGDHQSAQTRLAEYIIEKHVPSRRERGIQSIPVADVIGIYLTDVAPGQARPKKAAERCGRLLEFWGAKTLSEINGASCRAYAAWRGNVGGSRRDLQDLAAAIGHHAEEGLHRALVRVVLPPRGDARQRWITRDEAARLLRVILHTREIQEGRATDKRPLRHLARFLLIGLYTGSRPGSVMNATWADGPGMSFVDVVNGVFHRHPGGDAQTNKRKPTVKLSPEILGHLRRWKRLDGDDAVYVVTFGGEKVESVKTGLARACELAKLPAGVTAYTLRHSCASWLVQLGVGTRKIADFLGTSEEMIRKHYGHLAPDFQDEAASKIGRKRPTPK